MLCAATKKKAAKSSRCCRQNERDLVQSKGAQTQVAFAHERDGGRYDAFAQNSWPASRLYVSVIGNVDLRPASSGTCPLEDCGLSINDGPFGLAEIHVNAGAKPVVQVLKFRRYFLQLFHRFTSLAGSAKLPKYASLLIAITYITAIVDSRRWP
jgi:hypothetical protein